ncbi:unnamed protein product [Symbiodinium pilosum]|uniref:VWFD domain-containing protein n=1 Tax=Symbiodinium pilosum TaxID=2952 RepID=A0A812V2M7_SYMPI|nr:unnamed protein product [Symbiodinium pilosum]
MFGLVGYQRICVKSGSPNSGAGLFCYSGKQTCGTNGGPSNSKVDQTVCTKWAAPDKFCVVSLATNNNNPNNIQDLSNFAVQFGCCDGSGGVVGDPHIHTLDGNEFDLYDKGTYSVSLWTVQGLLLVDKSKGRFRQALELTSEDCQWRSKTGQESWSVVEQNASFQNGAINVRVSPQKAFEAKLLTGQIQAGNSKTQERFPVEETWESLGGSDSAASFLKEKSKEEKPVLVTSCTGDAKKEAEATCVEHLGEEARESEGPFFEDCVFDVCRGGESFAKAAAELRSLM